MFYLNVRLISTPGQALDGELFLNIQMCVFT